MLTTGLKTPPWWVRWTIAVPAMFVAGYSVVVLWYVATCPDLGYRVLLSDSNESFFPFEMPEDGVQVAVYGESRRSGVVLQESPNPNSTYLPRAGDVLCEINRRKVRTFLDFSICMAELRDAPLPPGGIAPENTDPSGTRDAWPGIVEVEGEGRKVEIAFVRRNDANPAQGDPPAFSYILQRTLPASEISLSLIWFLVQLLVLVLGATAFWNRPYDTPTRLFCTMCTLSLGAYVGGFHWWVIAGSRLLNVPFLICAGMLPAATLHFFLVYPNVKTPLVRWPVLSRVFLYGPPALLTASLVVLYLAAYSFNGSEVNDEHLVTVVELMTLLRNVSLVTIGTAAVYFGATVVTLGLSFFKTRNPLERRQVRAILLAASLSAIPMTYALALAVTDRVGFAFGRARIPMFFASLVFMLAYANGMVRHKMMLVDEVVGKGKLYYGVTALVMTLFAVIVALGSGAVHMLGETMSGVQLFVVFAVLITGVLLLLWLRDRVQQAIDRKFFREKYQLDKALQRMNRAAGHLADPQSLAQMMLGTTREAIQTECAAIYFRHPEDQDFHLVAVDNYDEAPIVISDPETIATLPDSPTQRVVSSSRGSLSAVQGLMHDMKAELLYPVESDSGIVALVVLGHKRRGTQYTAEDLTFLRAIAQITTIALHSTRANQQLARLNGELQAKVDRIAQQQRQLMILKAELDSSAAVASSVPVTSVQFQREEIKGGSEAILSVLETVRKVAPANSTVLIRGESGTGKELVARTLHRNSPRVDGPMISVHCASLSEGLLESELFGHAKGAFTGAHQDKVGRFEAANGGTLFLDEIGDISMETQVKLLRVLQERKFEPVGSGKTIEVDVRVVAATNRDLERMIEDGQFREDLYYRLNVIQVSLPPLRERPEDLIELVFHFINRSAERTGKEIKRIEPEALAVLECYSWPGNIRELENTIERAVVLTDGASITLRDLPAEMINAQPFVRVASSAMQYLPSPKPRPDASVPSGTDLLGVTSERDQLVSALQATGGNKAEAARRLGMPRSTFYSKLKKHQLS